MPRTANPANEKKNTYAREWRDMNKQMDVPENVEHGTLNAYGNYGCRCIPCSNAVRNYQLNRRLKLGLSKPRCNEHMHRRGRRPVACVACNAAEIAAKKPKRKAAATTSTAASVAEATEVA